MPVFKWNKILTKDFLIKNYVLENRTSYNISRMLNCGRSTICLYLKKYKIKVRNNRISQSSNLCNLITKKFLQKEYIKNKKSCKKLSQEVGCDSQTIFRYLKKYNIKTRSKTEAQLLVDRKMKRNSSWINGSSFAPYSIDWTTKLKEKIRARDNHKCQQCAMEQNSYYRKLDVHHIDYNKENCDENNLISLCQECHLKTNFNRDYWYAYYTYIMEKK